MDKSRALVTGGTKDDVAAMAVLAINIRDTNSHLFSKMIIFHDGIKKSDQDLIKKIFDTEFILYHLPFTTENDVVVNYFSPMVFCKYECLLLLNYYDEVVWSDYDVLIQGKMDDICTFEDGSLNIVVSDDRSIKDMFYKYKLDEIIIPYDLSLSAISTPLFAMKKDIGNHNILLKWCYEMTEKYDRYLVEPEQCVFSLMIQEFGIKYGKISKEKYVCHPRDVVGGEVILHAYCQPKFWNGLENKIWNEMYSEWKKMGGSKVNNKKKRVSQIIGILVSRIKGIRADGELAKWRRADIDEE